MERKWISVKDELPKKEGYCAVLKNGNIYVPEIKYYGYSEGEDKFFCDFDNEVTHWIQLPDSI